MCKSFRITVIICLPFLKTRRLCELHLTGYCFVPLDNRSLKLRLERRNHRMFVILNRIIKLRKTAKRRDWCRGSHFPRLRYLMSQTVCELKLVYSEKGNPVGTVTRYGLDGPGMESRWGRDFPLPSRPALGPNQPPIQWVPGVKRPGSGADHPPSSSARVKERVELYLYSPSGPSWPVLGRILPVPLRRGI
jgi:hypothetical protein